MEPKRFCTPCQDSILAALHFKLDPDSEGKHNDVQGNLPSTARTHDQMSKAGFFPSGMQGGRVGPIFIYGLQRNPEESRDDFFGSDASSYFSSYYQAPWECQLEDDPTEDVSDGDVQDRDAFSSSSEITDSGNGYYMFHDADESDDSDDVAAEWHGTVVGRQCDSQLKAGPESDEYFEAPEGKTSAEIKSHRSFKSQRESSLDNDKGPQALDDDNKS